MRKIFLLPVFLALTAGLAGCSKEQTAQPAEKPPEGIVKRGTNGETIITLDDAAQTRVGIKTETLTAIQLSPEIKGFGRILDPAPLGELLSELFKAELIFDNAHRELERAKVLRKDQNTSERAFQTAESTYLQAQVDATTIWLKIRTAWGEKLANLTGPIVVPVTGKRQMDPSLDGVVNFMIRVDIPAGETLKERPAEARILSLAADATPVLVQFFDFAPSVDPQTQSRGLFFIRAPHQPKLTPGTAVTAFIKTDGQPLSGVIIPRDAILRHNGKIWVWLQTEKNEFTRREIFLEQQNDNGWFVTQGTKADDKVVIVGAQQLLSEELKGQGGE